MGGCYVKKNRSVKLECYDKNIFDKYSDELLESVTRSRAQYIAAMKYLRSLLEKDVGVKTNKRKLSLFLYCSMLEPRTT
ncbi:MAG: hypothetical protein ACRDF4_03760, partial [Rhabdochlamydiaceae bacterium]